MSLRVAVLLVLCTILYSVDAAKNRAGDDSYEDHYRVSAFYDPNFKPEPFLSASDSRQILLPGTTAGLNDVAPVQLDTVTDVVRSHLRYIIGNILIAGFGLYIAFVYAVPYNLPKVRQLEEETFLQSLRLDPVDMAMDFFSISSEKECRQKLVCDARRLVSNLPYVDSWWNYSESARPSYKYEKAAARGAQGWDCEQYNCHLSSVEMLGYGFGL